jgi:hypothetical protein
MLKKILSIALVVLLFNVGVGVVFGRSQDNKQVRRVEKIKAKVKKSGTGPEARVKIKLTDGREFKGSIREVTDDGFMIIEEKTQVPVSVTYSQVAELKGNNGLTAAKVGITAAKGVGIVAGVAAAFTLLLYLVIPRT